MELRLFPSSCRLPNAVWEDCAAGSCDAVPLELCLFPSSCRLPNAVWEDCAAGNSHEGIPGRHISMYARPNGPLHESNPDTYGGQDPYRRICICDTVNPFANQISIHTRFKPLLKAFQEGTSPCMHDQMDPFTNQIRIHTEDKTLIDAYVYVTPSTPSPIKSAYIPGSKLSCRHSRKAHPHVYMTKWTPTAHTHTQTHTHTQLLRV